MTQIVEPAENAKIEKVDDTKSTKSIFEPEMCTDVDDDETSFEIEVILPGVDKDSLKLKMTEDEIFVEGKSDDTLYSGVYDIDFPIDVHNAKATYKNGLLKIRAPYKDALRDAVDVKID